MLERSLWSRFAGLIALSALLALPLLVGCGGTGTTGNKPGTGPADSKPGGAKPTAPAHDPG